MSDEHNDFDGIQYRIETKSPGIFRGLMWILVLWAVCFMAYYLFSGWSSQSEFAEKQQAKQEMLAKQAQGGAPVAGAHKEGTKKDYIALGAKEFAERCASCHSANAKGGIGPDLTRAEFTFGKSEAALTESIIKGRPGGMPAFGNDLSHEKVEGLVQYLLSLK